MGRRLVAAGALVVFSTSVANAKDPTPIDGLGAHLENAFTSDALFLYGAAVLATGGLAFSGADHQIRVQVQEHLASGAYGDAAYYGGYVLPVVVAPAIYLVGLASHDSDTIGAGSAAIQALAVTAASTGFLKLATGRPFPANGGDPHAPDRLDHPEYATEFSPFSLQWAWPSGHTSAAVSIAAALTGYTRETWVGLATYPIALTIGVGMIVGDHHWASDVVAGALIGQGIGYSIGSSFRRDRENSAASRIYLVPLAGAARGLSVVGRF